MVCVENNLFILGGFDGQEELKTVRRLDLNTFECFEEPPMKHRRRHLSSCALNGHIYVMGGADSNTRLRAAERYSPANQKWEVISDMNEQRSGASSCSDDVLKRVYCVGGFNGEECLLTAEFYCPLNKIWTQVTPMRSRRAGVSIISTGKMV